MEDIEKRGLPRYLTAYLSYKLGDTNLISEDLYGEVPNDLKECVDCIVEGKAVPDPSVFASYPIYFKEEIVEEVEEHGEEETKCATPTFSVTPGDVLFGTQVSLSCATNGAEIHYITSEWGEPTDKSPIYSEPFTINQKTYIKAIAIKEDLENSEIITVKYDPMEVVAIEDLDSFLKEKDTNSTYTPYRLQVTGLTLETLYGSDGEGDIDYWGYEDYTNSIRYILNQNPTKYVDLSPTDVYSVVESEGSIGYAFYHCNTLCGAPVVPNTLRGTFQGCSNINEVTIRYTSPTAHFYPGSGEDWGIDFDNLSYIYVSNYYEKDDVCNYVFNNNLYDGNPANFRGCVQYINGHSTTTIEPDANGVYNVSINVSYDLLNTLPANTSETLYKINLLNTRAGDWIQLSDDTPPIVAAVDTEERYTDLTPTTIPSSVSDISCAFYYACNIVKGPIIPNTVTNMTSAYNSCNIQEFSEIPNSVVGLEFTFSSSNVVNAPVIHVNGNSTANINAIFHNCGDLVTARFDGMNVVANGQYSVFMPFDGCTSLETVYVNTEADKTALYNLCHEMDSSDEYISLDKIVVDPINNSNNGNAGSIK